MRRWLTHRSLPAMAWFIAMTATAPMARATVITRVPTDDTYVRGGASATQNYDSDPYLRVKNGSGEDNDRQSLLRFDLAGAQGVVVSATLHLYCQALTNGEPAAAFVYSVADDAWQEDVVTWNTAPAAVDLLVGRTDLSSVGATYSFDVTPFVAQELGGDGVVSLLLRDDAQVKKAVDFGRREADHPPVLEIEMVQEYRLTAIALGEGEVTLSPPGGTYSPGTLVTLTALPAPGWRLQSWTGALTGASNPASLTMDADKNIWAAFEPIPQVSLQVNVSGLGEVLLDPPGGTYETGALVQVTAIPATGWSFDAWGGDLGGAANPSSILLDAEKSVTVTFTTSASVATSTTLEEVVSGGASSVTTVSTATRLTGAAEHLYLAAISIKPFRSVLSVSGFDLSWSLVREQCAGRGQTGVSLWMARGVGADSSTVTASLAGTVENAVITVSRYAGVDAVQPLGALVSGNTNGLDGLCSGGVDDAAYDLGAGSSSSDGIVFGAIAHRGASHAPGSGWSERLEVHQGTLGGAASLSLVERSIVAPEAWALQGSLSGDTDWAALAVEIRGATGNVMMLSSTGLGAVRLDPPAGVYHSGTLVSMLAEPAPGWSFVGWGNDVSGSKNPLSVLMDCNLGVAATFSSVPHHDLNLQVQGAGTVQVQPPGRRFASGTQVGISAVAFPGWTFTGWGGDVAGGTPSITCSMDADRQVTANFVFTGNRVTGLWSSEMEFESAPMHGAAWDALWLAANESFLPPDVADQNSSNNVDCLAAAIVYARTGDSSFRERVVQALDSLASLGVPGGTTLAWGRELGAYVLAADLVGYTTPGFHAWLRLMAEDYVGLDGRTLLETFEQRPNNWGTNAFGTLAAVYAYLQDDTMLRYVRDYWVQGVTGSPPHADFGDLSWQYDPARPRCINPPRVSRRGLDIDGAIADDLRRGGPLAIPPNYTGYPWGALQGIVMGARILERVDPALSIWHVEEKAIYRAAQLLQVRWEQQFGGWAAQGDDMWVLPFLDAAYGTSWSAGAPDEWGAGKNAGWAYVLLGEPGVPSSRATQNHLTYRLFPGAPNPFSRATDIRFSLPTRGPVHLAVYDALGRRVALLLDQARPAGMHQLRWNGRGPSGQPVASGVYWCRMQAGSHSETIRLVLLR